MVLLKNGSVINGAPLPPMFSIIDDDGHGRFYTDLLPLIQSKHVPIASSVIGKNIGVASMYMTWEQVYDAYTKGAEILNHTYQHLGETEDERTADEIYMDYTKNARLMESHGIVTGGDIIVFPGGSANLSTAQDAAHRFAFGAIRSSGNKNNDIDSTDLYKIDRYRIQTDYSFDLTRMKALIDNCTQGWMIWVIHTSDAAWGDTFVSTISESIDYAKSVGLSIVTVRHGIMKLRGLL